MKFEWDKAKELSNVSKHGVTFEQASYVFADPYALSLYDDAHSDSENRWIMLGRSLGKTLLLVVHTFRDDNDVELVRILVPEEQPSRKRKSIIKGVLYE